MTTHIPVIAIDGPTASGKGTVAACVAKALGWHFLDSGAVYRILAWAALQKKVPLHHQEALAGLADQLNIRFEAQQVWLDGVDIAEDLRREETGNAASKIAALPLVRTALLERQRAFRQMPGLVADGRDMGSVVFPDAKLKIYLTASVRTRAERRYKQLMGKGISANMDNLLQDLLERDARDMSRSVAPLKQCEDAVLLDTTHQDAEQAVKLVLDLAAKRFGLSI